MRVFKVTVKQHSINDDADPGFRIRDTSYEQFVMTLKQAVQIVNRHSPLSPEHALDNVLDSIEIDVVYIEEPCTPNQ